LSTLNELRLLFARNGDALTYRVATSWGACPARGPLRPSPDGTGALRYGGEPSASTSRSPLGHRIAFSDLGDADDLAHPLLPRGHANASAACSRRAHPQGKIP
jgi:hypothetical protein